MTLKHIQVIELTRDKWQQCIQFRNFTLTPTQLTPINQLPDVALEGQQVKFTPLSRDKHPDKTFCGTIQAEGLPKSFLIVFAERNGRFFEVQLAVPFKSNWILQMHPGKMALGNQQIDREVNTAIASY